MARTANYGLEELITACRFCDLPECECKGTTDLTREIVRARVREVVNQRLGPAHQLSQADIDKICLDLDRHPIGYRPDSSGDDEKPRNGREFERVVEQAFEVSPLPDNIEPFPFRLFPLCLSPCNDWQAS